MSKRGDRLTTKRIVWSVRMGILLLILILGGLYWYFFVKVSEFDTQAMPKLIPPDEIQYYHAQPVEAVSKKRRKRTVKHDLSFTPIEARAELLTVAEVAKFPNAQAVENRKRFIRNNISQFLFTNGSSFTVSETGISDVIILVENASEYIFEEVVITVQYLNQYNVVVSVQDVLFDNLTPQRVMQRTAPSMMGCRKVNFIVSSARSSALQMLYSPDRAKSGGNDPYKLVPLK